jgi:hypothetical protein
MTAARFINTAFESSKHLLVKTHVSLQQFGRLLQFKNRENICNYHSLSYYKYNYNLSWKCHFVNNQQKLGDKCNICDQVLYIYICTM